MASITSRVMVSGQRAGHHRPMESNLSVARSLAIGPLLRDWRMARRRSQLDLALDAGVSPRHLSYVETGKSRPSADLVEQLAETLDVPLRDRNGLLLAAGYAPRYRETPLDAPELDRGRQAVELILRHHLPNPAFAANRYWDVVEANPALVGLLTALRGRPPKHDNILHQIFDPEDMRPVIAGWEALACDLLRHLRRDIADAPGDTRLRTLLDQLLAYPDTPRDWSRARLDDRASPMIETRFHAPDGGELRFFSTLTTFAAPRDVTLSELRIESLFPADDRTAAFCRALAGAPA